MPTIFHLASEYVEVPGVNGTMNDLMAKLMEGGPLHNKLYFQTTAWQVAVTRSLTGLHGAAVLFDDVSQVRVEGGQTPDDEYFANVRSSVTHHCTLFAQHTPEVVIIAGASAFRAFKEIVVPALGANRPRAILRVRNPGAQGHRGNRTAWLTRYAEAERALAGALALPAPGAPMVEAALVSPNATSAFRLQ